MGISYRKGMLDWLQKVLLENFKVSTIWLGKMLFHHKKKCFLSFKNVHYRDKLLKDFSLIKPVIYNTVSVTIHTKYIT